MTGCEPRTSGLEATALPTYQQPLPHQVRLRIGFVAKILIRGRSLYVYSRQSSLVKIA